MADKKLEIIISAIDKATAPIKWVWASINSLSDWIRKNTAGFATLGIGAGVAMAGIVSWINWAVKEATNFENAFVGLKSIAEWTGKSFEWSKKFIQDFTKDWLMTAGDAATALKSLFQRGFSLEESVNLMNRFKDASSFGRQSALWLWEAVKWAAEWLKAENSMLVDNAGITQNVAKMWEIYAKEHNIKTDTMTLAQKREAEYQWVMRETKFQVWDATKYAEWYAWALARQEASSLRLQQVLGSALMPAMTVMTEMISKVVSPIADWAEKNKEISASIIIATTAILWLTAWLVALGFIIWPITAAISAIWVVLWAPLVVPILAVITTIGLLYEAWNTNFMGIWNITNTTVEYIKKLFGDIGAYIETNVNPYLELLKTQWGETFLKMQEVFITFSDWIGPAIKIIFDALSFITTSQLEIIKLIFTSWFEWIKTTVSVIFEWILLVVKWGMEILTWILKVLMWVLTFDWTTTWDGIKLIFSGAWNAIIWAFKIFSWAFQWIFKWVETFIIWSVDIVVNKILAIKNAIQWAISAVSDFWKQAGKNFSIQWTLWLNADFSQKVAWARALWWPVEAGKTYLVWENGPEYFTPPTSGKINNNASIVWGSPVININLGGVSVRNDQDMDKLTRTITENITRSLQLYKLWVS